MNLVTGACGHIGNVLVRELLAAGEKVRTLVLPEEDRTPLQGLDVEIVEGNVLDAQSLDAAFKDVEYAYHLAGIISIMPGRDEFLRTVNIVGTRNIIHAARTAGIRRLVYTSSIHALRRVPHGIVIDETVPFDPANAISAYDYSKAQASLEVRKAMVEGLDAVIACPTGVIGPYDYRRSEMGTLIFDCARAKPQFYVTGAYDFVDVRDVVKGLILARERGRAGETYILSGERITVLRLMESIREITGRHFPRFKVPLSLARFAAIFTPFYYRLARAKPRFTPYSLETITSNCDISHAKAERELGYSPRPLRESLRDTVSWFKEHISQSTTPVAS
ncbi:MAG: SDR family oxidoreductase [Anaerolineales bacterium]|nr:SDR family oxidoreductase [Anaerolineales bacterium]